MGREYRSIALSGDEACEALTAYVGAREDTQVNPKNIAGIEITHGSGFTAKVSLANPLLDGRTQIDLREEEIAEAIVAFIRSKGHPLPRRGRKSISLINDDIALLIELDWF